MKVEMTPDAAEKLLQYNDMNRPIREKLVTKYAEDMKKGWIYNGESIKISKTGRLLDGQHRLLACIESKSNFVTEIVKDLDDDYQVFSTLDTGSKRSLSDIISLAGFKYWVESAAIARDYYFWLEFNYEFGCRQNNTLRNEEGLVFFNKYKHKIDAALEFTLPLKHSHKNTVLPFSKLAFVYMVLKTIDDQAAQDFVCKIVKGTDLYEQHPILVLRSLLSGPDKLFIKGSYNSPYYLIDVVFKCWNFYRNNERIDGRIKRLNFKRDLTRVTSPLGYNREKDKKDVSTSNELGILDKLHEQYKN